MSKKSAAMAYAKALISLANDGHEGLRREFEEFDLILRKNSNLKDALFLNIFTEEEKKSVLTALFAKKEFSSLCQNFFSFLVSQRRMALFMDIFEEFSLRCDHKMGVFRGVIEGAGERADPEVIQQVTKYLKSHFQGTFQWTYKRNQAITCGHKVMAQGLQLDATVDHQLNQLRGMNLCQ